jgi:Rrf2 family protein
VKLTRAMNDALPALVNLAKAGREQPVASHLVAKPEGVPERFLLKILTPLVSARILYSVKGPNGAYRRARPPAEISCSKSARPSRGRSPDRPHRWASKAPPLSTSARG